MNHSTPLENRLIASLAALAGAVIWAHALAALIRPLNSQDPLHAWPLTFAALAFTLPGLLATSPRNGLWLNTGLTIAGLGLLALILPGSGLAFLSLLIVVPALTYGGNWLAHQLPPTLAGISRRRPLLTVLWSLLALLSLTQVARLSTYMTDPTTDWYLSTRNPFWAKHECMTAYFYGSELAERGEGNLYDAAHYPGLNPEAEPKTHMRGMVVEDPFQYPPQFLVLPTFARTLTQDFSTIRVLWFALQATFFAAIATLLALWIGGPAGRLAVWLLPLAFSAFPTLHALQYGQFHLAAIALSVAAFLAFEKGLGRIGGACLATAASAKIFPGILVLMLVVQKRWRELGWTLGFMSFFAALGWMVLGSEPYVAFFQYQLPRIADGSAFAFGEAWPEIRELIIADNQGVVGLVAKFQEMGLSFLHPDVAPAIGSLFGLLLMGFTAVYALRERHLARVDRAAGWLSILGLASLAGSAAFGDYVPLTAVWLLTLVSGHIQRSWRWTLGLGLGWIFQYTILGTAPLGDFANPKVMIPLSAIGAISMLWIFGTVLVGRLRQQPVDRSDPFPAHSTEGTTQPEPLAA